MEVRKRIGNLRNLMKQSGLDAYIIPSSDDHLSEYVSDHYKAREWISGFTGSAGTVVVTIEEAGLWTDGRYYIQANEQLKNSGIKLFREADPGVPSYSEWLKNKIHKNGRVGLDGNIFSTANVKELEKRFNEKGIELDCVQDLISELWKDRTHLPGGKIFIHDVRFAGKSRTEKLAVVRKEMKKSGANYQLLTMLDDIAWLLNIRGNDVPNNPVVICNVIVTPEVCNLFVDPLKVDPDVRAELESDGIVLMEPEKIIDCLTSLSEKDTIILDPESTNFCLFNAINHDASKLLLPDITTKAKAIKNRIEIRNLKECQVTDGIAMVRFIRWLKSSINTEEITEISASEKLGDFRKMADLYSQPSFDTIAAYKSHAAMMHYKATEESDSKLESEGFLLIDSGGQYLNGTTDITRTIVLGKLTAEQKRDFTLVLKGHIALGSARFLKGTSGPALDVLAREPIWRHGMDYKCGTGHGVGFFLNVHEGPHRISQIPNKVPLEEGMVVTNEPGIYKEGKYGIRIENMMLVRKETQNEFGRFLKFEPLTWCPIDLEAIDAGMLTSEEIIWINDYHDQVYKKLSPHLTADEKIWLKNETRRISQHLK